MDTLGKNSTEQLDGADVCGLGRQYRFSSDAAKYRRGCEREEQVQRNSADMGVKDNDGIGVLDYLNQVKRITALLLSAMMKE